MPVLAHALVESAEYRHVLLQNELVRKRTFSLWRRKITYTRHDLGVASLDLYASSHEVTDQPLHETNQLTMFTRTVFRAITLRSLPFPIFASTMSTSAPPSYPTIQYAPRHTSFPYTPADLRPQDLDSDTSFYSTPRFVTHIDDNAISLLRTYYAHNLPYAGRILDFCSSWVSHFPPTLDHWAVRTARGELRADQPRLEVVGVGLNQAEMDANKALSVRIVQDLNVSPELPPETVGALDAATCVVSIDYLTRPVEVLASVRAALRPGGRVHLVVSNRCFPTKVVRRWLEIGEQERLEMAAEYLWWAGFRGVEILTLCDGEGQGGFLGFGGPDPLWVVRGTKME